jgi:hypothetical protein
MKHALITLIIAVLFVVIVVPLIYIALGKLKNPIDLFALSKVGKSGMLTQKSNFISPNYIPEAGNSTTKKPTNVYAKVHEDAVNCFSEKEVIVVSEEYFSLEKKEGAKLNIRNDKTGTSRYFEGFYPTAVTEKQAYADWNTFAEMIIQFKPGCAKNGTTPPSLIAEYNDSGIFMARSKRDSDGFDFTDKGITTINGATYYWHMFEDKNRIYKDKDRGDTFYYSIYYSALLGNRVHVVVFNGTSLVFGSARDFLNQTQVFIGGTVYGTSTPAVIPPATTPTR